MKSGQCPKCGSEEIYSNKNLWNMCKRQYGPVFSNWGRAQAVDAYVCCSCGFVESYMSDIKEVAKIKSSGVKQALRRK